MGLKQTTFQVSGAVTVSGSVPIVFPTTVIPQTQVNNAQVSVASLTDAIVLPASASRHFAQIANPSTTVDLTIAFGNAASALTFPLPRNSVFTLDVSNIGEINQQDVHVFNNSGGAVLVNALSW